MDILEDIELKTPRVLLGNLKRLKNILKEEDITVVHTHHRMAAFYTEILGLHKKCYCINTCHNTFYDKKFLTRLAYRHIKLIACGGMVKKNLTDFFGIPDQLVEVIYNAVKPFDGKMIPDLTIEKLKAEGCFLVANVGRLSEQKGMEYFIRAVPDVIKKHPDTRFLIVGDGEDRQKLVQLSEDLKVNDCIIFMGYRSDIQNIMSQTDLVVLSSLWEGFPLTPIEAFSVGKTVVATAVDGTVEIVDDGKNGILIEPKNPEQIAEKVIWIQEHLEEKKKMESEAKEEYEREFSIDEFKRNYRAYYERQ